MSEGRVELPADFQEQLARLQQLQQTLQMIVAQKQQVELELADMDKALEELGKLSEDAQVYKSVGAIFVRKDKASVTKDLAERKELLNVRMSVLSKQEERTREKLKEIQQQIQSRLRQFQPSQSGG
ncbi:MAG: prefoldin, beta-like subunit (pfdB, PFDN6) [Candidatus Hecatellales archaeon B24]|nr:MAG: prefoldin, beta-like subunit (pfdB, PFDN6) [Candidatus Hecatellales archaeon B24]